VHTKKIIVLLVILVVLSAVAYVAYESKKPPERPPADSQQAKLFPSLKADEVAQIKIRSLGSEARLVRDDSGTWVVPDKGNYTADAKAIDRMLDAITTMDKGTVVSRNPEKQLLYEVDKIKGTEVTVLDKHGKELAHFFVGKAGQDFFSTNICLAGENEVRLVHKMLSYMFKRTDGDWREKEVFTDADEEKLVKYTVVGAEGSASFAKSETGTWSTIEPAGKEVAPEDAKRAVSGLAKLRISGFAEDKNKDKFELDKPKWTITATGDDDRQYALKICGERSKAQFFVQRVGKDTVFYTSKYQVERLTKPYKDALGIKEEKTPESKSLREPKRGSKRPITSRNVKAAQKTKGGKSKK